MRSIVFQFALLLSLTGFISGQEKKLTAKEVPSAVTAASRKQFPGARVSGWSQESEEGKMTYEASVADKSGKRDVVFSETGDLLAIEQVIAVNELPAQVKDALHAKYSAATLRKAEKITRGPEVQYEVDLIKAARKGILLSAGGKILKEE